MHRLLRRQLRKHLGIEGEVPAALQPFVAAVDTAYADFDSDRALLERSQELSSKELSETHDKAAQAQTRLTASLRDRGSTPTTAASSFDGWSGFCSALGFVPPALGGAVPSSLRACS